MEQEKEQDLNSIVQSSTMLLAFEGWIKYIEGFSRGLQTTKSVDASEVFDCIAEIMEYMKTLKSQLIELLLHCEQIMEEQDICNSKINDLQLQTNDLITENKQLKETTSVLLDEKQELTAVIEKLVQERKETNNAK